MHTAATTALGLTAALLLSAAPPAAPKPERVNAAALVAGARTVGENGNPVTTGAFAFDGTDQEWEWQPGESGTLVLELAEPFDLTRVEALNSGQEDGYPGIGVRSLRLEAATRREGPWAPLAELALRRGPQPQGQDVAARAVRYLRVTATGNHGNKEFTALRELRVLGTRTTPRTVRFTGAWDTSFGQMVLTQEGERVFGCYGSESGGKVGLNTVEGTVEGPVFAGTWRERSSDDAAAGEGKGAFVFALDAEGDLTGVWGASLADRDARWDGTRRAKATVTCARPEAELAGVLQREGRAVLRGLLFDTGKATLRPESLPVLEALAQAMRASASTYVLEGHTDDRGGAAFNQGLSEKRAEAVRAWLVKAGVAGTRLEARGFGMGRPVLPNDSEAGRAANRRVEVVVTP